MGNNKGGGLFGNNNNNNNSGGLFGNKNNNSGGGLFGNKNNNSGGGLFGNNNNNNNSGGGLFGNNNNNSGGGLFGNNNSNNKGGLFGNNNNNNSSGLFGSNNKSGGNMFGNNSGGSSGLFNTGSNNSNGFNFGSNNSNQTTVVATQVYASANDDPYQIKWKVDQSLANQSTQTTIVKPNPKWTPKASRPIVRLTNRPRRRLARKELWAVAIPNALEIKQPDFTDSILAPKPRKMPRKKLKLPELPPELEKRLKESERKTGVSDKAPRCTNEVLELTPTIAELKSYTDKELSQVRKFRIAHPDVGAIEFLEPVDCRNIDFGEIVIFKKASLHLYPRNVDLPPVGKGLNHKAKISLYNVWPKKNKDNPSKLRKWEKKLQSQEGRDFVSFDRESGTWEFIVQHF